MSEKNYDDRGGEDSVPAVEGGFLDPILDDAETDDAPVGDPVPLITEMEGIAVPDSPFDLGPAGEERMDGGGGGTASDNPIESGIAGSDQEPKDDPNRFVELREPEDL